MRVELAVKKLKLSKIIHTLRINRGKDRARSPDDSDTILKIFACFSNSYNPYDREGGACGQKTLKLPRRIHILPINGARTGQEVLLASAVITGDLCRIFALV